MRFVNLSLAFAATSLVAFGCAHSKVQKHEYAATTNPVAEIQALDAEMTAAAKNQAHVLSPDHFAQTRKKLETAKRDQQDGDDASEVLETLGYARAHLDAANSVTTKAEAAIPEVAKARAEAVAAEAPKLRAKELTKADAELIEKTEDFERGKWSISSEQRDRLAKNYLDVQVLAMKSTYLGETMALIEASKKMNAKKYAHATLASAEAKLQTAERTIETDRNNTAGIVRVSDEARAEAKRLHSLTEVARDAKDKSPEEIALLMEAKQKELDRTEAIAESRGDRLATARDTIATQNSALAVTNSEKAKLEKEQAFNAALAQAEQSFTKDEAEVYRQGDNLIVRLKSIRFPTGRAELPKNSMPVLAKVKDVIESMGAEKVRVEGHTDATGSKALNQTLSEKRAASVGQYFVSNEVVPSEQLEAQGFGDSRPIVTNKTKEGRAQNRRVDVIITPAGT